MIDKLQSLEDYYEQLGSMISDPDVIANQVEWQKHAKAHAKLSEIVVTFRDYKRVLREIQDTKQLLEQESDAEMRSLAQLELSELNGRMPQLADTLKILLLPKDPNDEKNVIVEIRGAAGGDEAALFAGDLFRMYTRYAERQGWKTEMLNSNPTELGGFKEVVFAIEGEGAYSRLKFESGVHRVQRIPTTESGGRIHTSTVTVAVLPEVEEADVDFNMNDLRIDTFRAGGAGGQYVNKTESAIRITHIPTNIVVQCQDEKSQLKNKDKALKVLLAKLQDLAIQNQKSEIAADRRSQVGTGDRSERIRTYNFPQGRVTDHRIGLTLHQLDAILDGDLVEIIQTLITSDQSEKLKQVQ